jgi:thioesterase domain-containing protein/acyl carrier protein
VPAALVPSAIGHIDVVPLTATGKVDRRSLADPPRLTSGDGEPPGGDTEVALAGIWRDLLELDGPIHRDDDFFALGGHSLLAIELVAEIERTMGCELGLSQIVELPSLEAMASAISAPDGGARSSLVHLRAGGAPTHLFWLPGVGGTTLSLHHFVGALTGDHPVTGFEAAGHRGLPLTETIEQAAAEYVADLLAVHDGPYVLGGYSLGALIAQEMAVQLAAAGRPPAELIVVDPYLPPVAEQRITSRLARAAFDARRRLRKQVRTRRQRPAPRSEAVQRVKVANRRAAKAHQLGVYDGPSVVISTAERRVAHGGAMVGFAGALGGPVRTRRLRGGHGTLMNGRHAGALAAAVSALLAEVDQGVGA